MDRGKRSWVLRKTSTDSFLAKKFNLTNPDRILKICSESIMYMEEGLSIVVEDWVEASPVPQDLGEDSQK